jgi:hypothetical protein
VLVNAHAAACVVMPMAPLSLLRSPLHPDVVCSLIACSVCAEGYFEQFGLCKQCPQSKSLSALAILAVAIILVALGLLAFKVRHGLPVDVIKLGIST